MSTTILRMMSNKRHHNESHSQYRTRQRNMRDTLKQQKKGRVLVPMYASHRLDVQRGGTLRTHHDPDKNYGSLSSHKRCAAIRANKPSKLLLVARGMARLHKAFNINV